MSGITEESSLFNAETYIGSDINNITLVELLGRGAMGAVFVGYQKSLKRKVALKVFHKEAASENIFALRFKEEAEIVAVLHHPNIVTVFDMGETDEFIFISMQLISGEDLRSIIRRQKLHPLPSKKLLEPEKVLSIMIPILDALAYAHEEGVIHQDIKPGNILIEERTQRPYLVDFGIASSTTNESCGSNAVLGTPLYIAPELICGTLADVRCDIYSAGVVLYEALAGKLPYQNSTFDELLSIKANNPGELFTIPLSKYGSSADSDLENIIMKAVACKPENRFQTSRGFCNALKAYRNTRFGPVDI